MNPLDIPAVRDRVLLHVGGTRPHRLLNTRLVNQSWKAAASALLRQSDWKIQLNNAWAMKEYLRLHQTVSESIKPSSCTLIEVSAGLELGLNLDLSTGPEILATAMSIIEQGYAPTGIDSLQIKVGSSVVDSCMIMALIRLVSSGLRCISLHIPGERVCHAGAHSCANTEPPLKLPSLRSFHIKVYSSPAIVHVAMLRQIISGAPGLQSLHIDDGLGPIPDGPDFIAAITDIHSRKRLLGLELCTLTARLVCKTMPHSAKELRFERLRALRIRGRPESLASWSQFDLHIVTPNLQRLEIFSKRGYWFQEIQEMEILPLKIPFSAPNPGALGFNFVFHTKYLSESETRGILLKVLTKVPLFQVVTTNFGACLSFVQLFCSEGGKLGDTEEKTFLPELFQQSKWPSVTRLHLETGEMQMKGVRGLKDGEIPSVLAFLLGEMFPNADEIVINFGVDSVCVGIQQVLALIFGIKNLRRAEITNYCGTYLWENAEDKEMVIEHVEVPGRVLERLTIRGSAVRAPCALPPSIDPHMLVALIPERAKAGLEVEVEVELLQGWGKLTWKCVTNEKIQQVCELKYPFIKLL